MATKGGRDRDRPGRPTGSPPNREAILAAARAHFTSQGYDRATIRGIASEAGVDPALVYHYFGSKDQLLGAALELHVNLRELVPSILAGGVDGLGERYIRQFLDTWASDRAAGGALVALIRSSVTNDDAARMMREFFTSEGVARIVEALDVPQPRLRAALAASQLIGLAMARYVVGVEPIASADLETLVGCYAPTLQRYLTGPLPGDDKLSASLKRASRASPLVPGRETAKTPRAAKASSARRS
jgi:AcrR family transcriptional regulator